MLDFTGERVVPGLVDPNLFNEHLARYRFAAKFAAGCSDGTVRVLDAGCGSGYGSAQFGPHASVVGIDVAADAIRHAREQFGSPTIHFVQAGCEALPFADASFDLVAAFEVIEHIEGWRTMLLEAKRTLKPGGRFLVSTPNKTVYAESRGGAGPNPYHVHEFEAEEFAAALHEVFPHVDLWSQNHAEGIAFVPAHPAGGGLDVSGDRNPADAHFLVAACGSTALPRTDAFAWLPASGNVLRERERHVALLEEEVGRKTQWLEDAVREHETLKREHDALLAELEQHNQWARKLDAELAGIHLRYGEQIQRLQEEAEERLNWVRNLERQIQAKSQEALDASKIIDWQKERMEKVRGTRWFRLGRQLGFIPPDEDE